MFLALKRVYLLAVQRSPQLPPGDRLCLIPFLLTFAIIMLAALHGTSILKLAVIFALNFAIAKLCRGSRLTPLLTWAFNMGVLFMNEWNEGYRFGRLHSGLQQWVSLITACLQLPNRPLSRIIGNAYILAGMSSSTSQCYGWSPSIWITIGPLTEQDRLM